MHEAQALAAQAVRLRAAVALLAGAVAHHWRRSGGLLTALLAVGKLVGAELRVVQSYVGDLPVQAPVAVEGVDLVVGRGLVHLPAQVLIGGCSILSQLVRLAVWQVPALEVSRATAGVDEGVRLAIDPEGNPRVCADDDYLMGRLVVQLLVRGEGVSAAGAAVGRVLLIGQHVAHAHQSNARRLAIHTAKKLCLVFARLRVRIDGPANDARRVGRELGGVVAQPLHPQAQGEWHLAGGRDLEGTWAGVGRGAARVTGHQLHVFLIICRALGHLHIPPQQLPAGLLSSLAAAGERHGLQTRASSALIGTGEVNASRQHQASPTHRPPASRV
mmetsp:Transcript_98347/g.234109  ORF Transcript_98347/g.234109 Transcript_98347/m.234109 type:complete len:330 (+) Transcript_98347:1120-2109(+)